MSTVLEFLKLFIFDFLAGVDYSLSLSASGFSISNSFTSITLLSCDCLNAALVLYVQLYWSVLRRVEVYEQHEPSEHNTVKHLSPSCSIPCCPITIGPESRRVMCVCEREGEMKKTRESCMDG